MIPRAAQYLLRIDDLCPTFVLSCWERYAALVEEFGIQPILAVVPDNQDPSLDCASADPEFWSRMRAFQKGGAAIALHGYKHLCLSSGKSMIPLHTDSEFAGVPVELQQQWIHAGIQILRGHGLNPRIWVAPRHGFDRQTLQVLREEGIDVVSDGLARVPFVRDGLTWIPQQIWEPMERPNGLWTICVHTNTSDESDVERMRAFLERHGSQLTTIDRVLAEWKPGPLSLIERAYEAAALWRVKAIRVKKGFLRSIGW